ncbi:MAG: GIY-YIG nuclease family protein [Bacteroidota bacterium]
MPKQGYVYILVSKRNGTLYTGVTSDLSRRMEEHRAGVAHRFTRRFGVNLLVYYELHDEIGLALSREKQIKNWKRIWKLQLIESINPNWVDLSSELM